MFKAVLIEKDDAGYRASVNLGALGYGIRALVRVGRTEYERVVRLVGARGGDRLWPRARNAPSWFFFCAPARHPHRRVGGAGCWDVRDDL